MTTQQDLLSILVMSEGLRPGRGTPFQLSGPRVADFPGVAQATFLALGHQVADLAAALSAAVEAGWLSLGQFYAGGGDGTTGSQMYVLEQAGFVEAGGTAPTQAASAQQLLNVAAAINDTPGAGRFSLDFLTRAFVGTVGDNTFAPEDVMPGYGYALSQGWVRPVEGLNGSVFSLTSAGVAQAAA